MRKSIQHQLKPQEVKDSISGVVGMNLSIFKTILDKGLDMAYYYKVSRLKP